MQIHGTLIALVAGCGRGEAERQEAPRPRSIDARAVEHDTMEQSRFTSETDRQVIEYLDRFDPLFTSLFEAQDIISKRASAFERGKTKDEAERAALCELVNSTLADHAAWRASHPIPSALSDAEIDQYQNEISQREDEESLAVLNRVMAFAGVQGGGGGEAGIIEYFNKIAARLAC